MYFSIKFDQNMRMWRKDQIGFHHWSSRDRWSEKRGFTQIEIGKYARENVIIVVTFLLFFISFHQSGCIIHLIFANQKYILAFFRKVLDWFIEVS